MKIVAILGSPRKDGNSSILAREALKAAREQGADTEECVLNEISFRGCQGCDSCKDQTDHCVTKDDLIPVLESVRNADAVVFASPVYYGEVSGQLKCFWDRTYSFFDKDFSSRLKPGKKSVFILTQGNSDEKAYSEILSGYQECLRNYGFVENHSLLAAGIHAPGEVNRKGDLLEQARALGRKLVG